MTISKHTFIDAYGIELNDELNGRYAEQGPRNDRGQVANSQPQPRAGTSPTLRRQYRFDEAQNRQTLRGPHFRVPPGEPAAEEATWTDMSVIDVGAGWTAPPETTAPAPAESIEPERVAPRQITRDYASQPATVAETTVAETSFAETTTTSRLETADEAAPKVEVARTVAEAAPEPARAAVVPKPLAGTPVAGTPVKESVETGGIDSVADGVAEVTETKSLPATKPVVPAWEVDQFAWPADVEALFQEHTDYFEHAGQKLLAASREGLTKLAITSALPGEGTTTVALCLARAVAAVGGRVAVLDGNLRNSKIGRVLNLEFASGWQGAATGATELAEAAIASLNEGITLFPATAAEEAVGGLADELFREVLRSAAAGFDLLLIDAGQEDFGENAQQIDAAMVVRDVRRTSEQQSLAAALHLKEAGVKAVGIAENFSQPHQTAVAA